VDTTTTDNVDAVETALWNLVGALDSLNGMYDDGGRTIPPNVYAILGPVLRADSVNSLDGIASQLQELRLGR
jgi:hypothetical protein